MSRRSGRSGGSKATARAEKAPSRLTIRVGDRHRGGARGGGRASNLVPRGASSAAHSLPEARHSHTRDSREGRQNMDRRLRREGQQGDRRKLVGTSVGEVDIFSKIQTKIETTPLTSYSANIRKPCSWSAPQIHRWGNSIQTRGTLHNNNPVYRETVNRLQ